MQRYHTGNVADHPILWLEDPCNDTACTQPHRFVLDDKEGQAREMAEKVVQQIEDSLHGVANAVRSLFDRV